MVGAAFHILVVDDDEKVRRMLRRLFEDEGFLVSEAADGEGVDRHLALSPDLVTLDLNLGGTDGLSIAREIRRTSEVPIIIISGKGDMIDRIIGLEIGADDYIAKPFHLREVLARVRTVLRRSRPKSVPGPATVLVFDRYTLDVDNRTLDGPDGSVPLTSGEFDLLVMFAQNPHRVFNRDQIMDRTKGLDWAPLDRSIDNQIARLRKKIEEDPAKPRLLKTVRGAGYTFTPSRGPLH